MRFPLFVLVSLAATALAAPENLLRNGSFEGAMLYWHNVSPKDYEFVRGGTPVGEMALKLKSGSLMSAPFVAKRGEWYTVSLFAKGEKPGTVSVSMPPSAREVGQKAGRLWTKGAGQSAPLTTEWQRFSFSWPADVPADGFWTQPHYLVQISGNKDNPLFVDGVTVTAGKEAAPAYLPRRPVEAVADCTNLPGWDGPVGNAFEKGATAEMLASVSNPGSTPQTVSVRWQLIDYEGEGQVSAAIEKKVTIPPGRTLSEKTPLTLKPTGLVYARLSVFDAQHTLLDQSDFPLTSLPYPKAATKPDYRERFGGSFAGGLGVIEKMQRLGFGWARWQPHANGADHLPQKPDNLADSSTWAWKWADAALDRNESHGISSHLVLYPPPKWIMEKGHPLPTDMRWPASDPRWDDLSLETVWDKFVRAAAEHYGKRSVIFEIENEPEFDRWTEQKLGDEYAKFTIRTAKLLRKYAPPRQIMVNNVYGIPSSINSHFFKSGGLAHIDVVSWHDYHSGWLTDASGIKRMRQNMDAAGGQKVELWFNEGWAYTNTAVDEPIACTSLTSVQSTNAIAASTAEMSVAGQEKTVMFHLAYEDHGQSFWDYSGPGQMLWDWYGYPTPLVAMWNVLNHHIGISDEVGFVRPLGANLCVFQDLRNRRGVLVAYADRDAKADATLELPDVGSPWIAEDIMGNTTPLEKRQLTLRKTGRPVLLYTKAGTPGAALLAPLQALDRKHAGFITKSEKGATYQLPASWEGVAKGSAEGNPILAGGQPVWRLEQLLPKADKILPASYAPLIWEGTRWTAAKGGQGGQPGVNVLNGNFELGLRGPWSGPGLDHQKTAALVFLAPAAGHYKISGIARAKKWEGNPKSLSFSLGQRDTQRYAAAQKWDLPPDNTPVPFTAELDLAAGHELLFLPECPQFNVGATFRLEAIEITRSGD